MNIFKTAVSTVKTGARITKNFVKANAPTLLLGGGIGAATCGVIEIAKAHKNIDEYIAQRDADMEPVRQHFEAGECSRAYLVKEYLIEDAYVASHYVFGVVLYTGGIVSVVASHAMMANRLNFVITLYNGAMAGWNEYRARVRAELGDDADRKFMTGTHEETYTYDGTTKTGKTRKKTVTEDVMNEDGESLYMRLFSHETSRYFDDDGEANDAMIGALRRIGNEHLVSNGALFMDEVCNDLGLSIEDFPEVKVTGWLYDPHWYDYHTTPQFDFVIHDDSPKFPEYDPSMQQFGKHQQRRVWIEFLNADGYILDEVAKMGFRGQL